MADPHVITALLRKYTEILTLLRAKDAEAAELRAQLLVLSKAISIYKPGFDASEIFPKRSHKHNLHFPRGMFYRVVMDILREADRPLSAGELARAALERQGAPTDAATVNQFRQTLNGALVKYARDGRIVRREGERPQRWELVR
ncbi:MAG TPA: hypothetical protein VHW09_27260 [Bryobacteraceae bacterium]|jgi:hypothetical protein|nr:hypothetical protein [Bryobacteraceae bacterium]